MFTCQICGLEISNKGIGSHLRRRHKMANKEYYDKYIKTEQEGICINCGNPTNFSTIIAGYHKYCSTACASSSPEVREKVKQTNFDRHGGIGTGSKEIAAKIAKTKEDRYGDATFTNREKCKQTCIERYGVDNVYASKEIIEKKKQTYLEHYGVDNPFKLPEIREKGRQTMLRKYGYSSYGQSEQSRNYIRSSKFKFKRVQSLCLNGTHLSSKLENRCFTVLKNKFPNAIHHYISEKYPFECDFYVPESDLYIECHFFWTHGGHFFDKNNLEDIAKLEKWKSEQNAFYDNAIYTWTIRDLEKRQTAIDNNLNYLVFWTEQEFIDWINI